MATVKGDVHDIGKNIVGVVLACNNYEVIDLGRHGPGAADPRDRARGGRRPHRAVRADHPVARGDAPRRRRDGARGLRAPAAHRRRDDVADPHRGQDRAAVPRRRSSTSPTRRGRSASPAALVDEDRRDAFAAGIRDEYETLRRERGAREEKIARHPIAEARRHRLAIDWTDVVPPRPTFLGVRTIDDHPLEELVDRIDWTPFFATWELNGALPGDPDDPVLGPAARSLHDDALALLDRIVRGAAASRRTAVVGFWPANSVGDDIELYTDETRTGLGRHDPHAAPADGQAAGPAEPGPRRLHRAARDRASPTTSAASR